MESTEANRHRKREFVIIKHGTTYYYARASRTDPDMYQVMASVGAAEGAEIVKKANAQSDMNREIDHQMDTAEKFMSNWKKESTDEEQAELFGTTAGNKPI